jgi:hypothetical protein
MGWNHYGIGDIWIKPDIVFPMLSSCASIPFRVLIVEKYFDSCCQQLFRGVKSAHHVQKGLMGLSRIYQECPSRPYPTWPEFALSLSFSPYIYSRARVVLLTMNLEGFWGSPDFGGVKNGQEIAEISIVQAPGYLAPSRVVLLTMKWPKSQACQIPV